MFQIGEIVWARVRGYPWWPGRVVNPAPDELERMSIDKVAPDQRLVWFFNDNDNHLPINVKNIRPFCDEQRKADTRNKTGKHAARLKTAFQQASAEHRLAINLDEDDDAIDAVVISPVNTVQARSSARQPRTSKKRKASDLNGCPQLEQLPRKQLHNSKRRCASSFPNATHGRPKPVRDVLSQKKTHTTGRASGDGESDRLSTHCNPSPCDRSSQDTGIDTHANDAAANDAPPRSNLLRLRIREKSTSTDKDKKKDSAQSDSSAFKADRARREKKRKASDLPPKLRHGAIYKVEKATRRKRQAVTERGVERVKLELSEARSPDLAKETTDGFLGGSSSDEGEVKASNLRRRMSASKPSTVIIRIGEAERVSRSDGLVRRSGRMRKASSKVAGTEDESEGERGDEDRRQVASKRSRGVEAPRKSDGQRRMHIRQEGNGKRYAGEEDAQRAGRGARDVGEDKESCDAMDEAARPFQDLSKDECIKVILRMQDALRRKSVQLWLRGRKLVEARDVVRTEEDLIKSCESGIVRTEKLLRWAKKNEGYDKGEGSPFSKMEKKAAEDCEGLVDVYFDRRRVTVNKIGHRVLKLTKEMAPHSRRITNVLEDLLVLWLDLTSCAHAKSKQ